MNSSSFYDPKADISPSLVSVTLFFWRVYFNELIKMKCIYLASLSPLLTSYIENQATLENITDIDLVNYRELRNL